MPIPKVSSIEMPILQELVATGGADNLRFLYERLPAYFPQLSEKEIRGIKDGKNKSWRIAVQKAGKFLDEQKLIEREHGNWVITDRGRKEVEKETSGFTLTVSQTKSLSHTNIQEMLVKIGESLGFYAETEFEFYDVIWRETPNSPRISHIFEVQSKGNIDSAFAKLKRAYQAQRTKPFLVIASERDLNRARQSLSREFHDIETVVTILTFAQIKQVHQNLKNIAEIIKEFLLK
ncbi:MAG: hypothetical protein ABI891_07370 [Acidobacteriota bacterium]